MQTYEEKLEYNKSYYDANKLVIQAQRRQRRNTSVRGRMIAIVGNAKQRAKTEGFDFDISKEFLIAMWEEQNGFCAITGQEMSLETDDKRWSSLLVSLDRIDSNKGYTMDNVWLVGCKVNYAKGVQSYADFVEMCRLVVEHSK